MDEKILTEDYVKNLFTSIGYKELGDAVVQGAVRRIADEMAAKVSHFQKVQGQAERVTAAAEARKVELDKYNADAEARLAGTEKKIIENEKKIAAQADLQSELDKLKKEYDQYRAKVEKDHAHFAERVG
jgi:chromosome segregation ATPase